MITVIVFVTWDGLSFDSNSDKTTILMSTFDLGLVMLTKRISVMAATTVMLSVEGIVVVSAAKATSPLNVSPFTAIPTRYVVPMYHYFTRKNNKMSKASSRLNTRLTVWNQSS